MANDPAPWIGLGGVVLGGLLALTSTTLQEWARRRFDRDVQRRQLERDDEIRFEQRRFDAYVALITAANRVYAACKSALAGQNSNGTQIHAAHEQFLAALSPAFLLTSSTQTHDRIADLAKKVRELVDVVATSNPPLAESPHSLFDAHREAIKAVELAMRVELGVSQPANVQDV